MAASAQGTDQVVLDAMPSAAGLYARALAPRSRPPVASGLPDRTVTLLQYRSTIAEVARYDAVCGFGLTDALPATWLHVLTFPLQLKLMTADDFPLAPTGMVHVSNTMVQHRPTLITEAPELSVRAERLRPHRRGVLIDLVGEARVGGSPVWQGRSTYLSRAATLPGEPDAEASAPDGDAELHAAGLWRLPADLGRRYAAASGDVNPIHLNPLAAKAFGFPRTIAHGMWSHARVLAALQPRLPKAFEVAVQFTKPVLLPSTVRYWVASTDSGFVARLTDRSGEKVHLRLGITAR